MFVCREGICSIRLKTDRQKQQEAAGCLLLNQISLKLDQHQRTEVSSDNGNYHDGDGSSDQIKRIESAQTCNSNRHTEERAIPEANWSGEIMNAAFKPTLAAISGIIGAKLKKAALPEPITKAEPTTMRNITVKTA